MAINQSRAPSNRSSIPHSLHCSPIPSQCFTYVLSPVKLQQISTLTRSQLWQPCVSDTRLTTLTTAFPAGLPASSNLPRLAHSVKVFATLAYSNTSSDTQALHSPGLIPRSVLQPQYILLMYSCSLLVAACATQPCKHHRCR